MFKLLDLRTVFRSAKLVNFNDNTVVKSVEHDTRRIRPQSLYIAIKGESLDGHDFINDAQNKGAVACICERQVQGITIPQVIVKDSVNAYGELANFWRKKLKCPVFALTGSNGKTTTKELIYAMLSKKIKTARTSGNFNNLIGVPYTILSFPLDIECAVIEMGMNAKGEIAELARIADPDIALITNIGRAHVGRLGSMDAVANAKMELFDHVLKKKGTFCINLNDVRLKKWLELNDPKGHITYCVMDNNYDCSCDVCIKSVSSDQDIQSFIVVNGKTKEELNGEIKLPGVYNLVNVAAAMSVAKFFGVDLKVCVNALKDFVPPSMRSNILRKDGVTYVIDCYNANPDSMLASIRSFETIKGAKRKIVVVGDMFELDGAEEILHKEIGQELNKGNFDAVYAIGKYASYYKKGFDNGIPGRKLFVYDTTEMQKMKKDLFSSLIKGDHVLVKASRASKLETIFDK